MLLIHSHVGFSNENNVSDCVCIYLVLQIFIFVYVNGSISVSCTVINFAYTCPWCFLMNSVGPKIYRHKPTNSLI